MSALEEADEDVVHIQKRADVGPVESDNLNYSGWSADGKMDCTAESTDPSDSEEEECIDSESLE